MAVIFTLLILNFAHGMISGAWIFGLRRVAGPLPADLEADLLSLAVALPALAMGAWLVAGPSEAGGWVLLRAGSWARLILGSGLVLPGAFLALEFGTFVISAAQELLPLLQRRSTRFHAQAIPHPRLTAALAAARLKFPRHGRRPLFVPRAELLPDERVPVAMLKGMLRPRIVVSRALLDRLTDEELAAVVAHELGHVVHWSNMKMLLLWILRTLQLSNPFALILFRSLVETREKACDSFAAWLTGDPEALARAIRKVETEDTVHLPPEERIQAVILRRAEIESARARVSALLSREPLVPTPRLLKWVCALVLAGGLWSIR